MNKFDNGALGDASAYPGVTEIGFLYWKEENNLTKEKFFIIMKLTG